MSQFEDEVRRFESEISEAMETVNRCADLLRTASDPNMKYLIAERLPALGSALIPAMENIFSSYQATRSESYLAAWVAIEVGERAASISVLCREVEADSEWSLPAANVLARHGIAEATRAVQEALSRAHPSDVTRVLGFATALRDLGGELPGATRERLLSESPGWVARAIAADFPVAGEP